MTDTDYDSILDEIERHENFSLKGMWVLIVTSNSTDDNNNNAIFNVVFNSITIKYKYVNIISIFVWFFMFIILLDSVTFILLKNELATNCI